MKTLYININGEAIKNDNNIEVIGSEEDSIVDSFYISLGEAIADGVAGIKYKPLVADFANAKPNEFNSFSDQWQEVKTLLLGENPSGDYDFALSSEYLDWLKMNATYSTIYYKKYQNQHQAKVKLNLDELYEDTVDAIRRKVIRFLQTDDKYKNFGEFVVNDYAATRRSLLVRSIKDKFEDIAFVLFERWEASKTEDKETYNKCGEHPCEIKQEEKNRTCDIENGVFSYDGITLGKTTLSELKEKGYKIHRGYWRYDNKHSYVSEFRQYSESYIVIDNWDYKNVEEWCEYCFANPSIVNRETLFNTPKNVTYLNFKWNDCPFLVYLGFYGDEDFDEEFGYDDDEEYYDEKGDDDYKNREISNYIAELFEDKGYVRIEPLMVDDNEHNITLVNPKPNANGDYIFITITDYNKRIEFYSNLVIEWTSVKTGEVFRINKENR